MKTIINYLIMKVFLLLVTYYGISLAYSLTLNDLEKNHELFD